MSFNFSGHWHKILALLMHEFEINQFDVTEASLKEFTRQYGESPAVTYEESDGVLRIKLATALEVKRLVQ